MNDKTPAADFDENAALEEVRLMWLGLGRWLAAGIEEPDWIDGPEAAQGAIQTALQAEACLWRATGGCEAADVSMIAPGVKVPAND